MKRRSKRDRRAHPYRCRRCGEELRVSGSSTIGARILKCDRCNVMDRRLPEPRRVLPDPLPKETPGCVQLALTIGVLLAAVAGVFWGIRSW